MFWRFGGYANISTIDSVLDKPDVTLDEVLDESDLLQELKQHNTKLIEFLRDDAVFQRLLDYVISPSLIKSEDEVEGDDDGKADVEKEEIKEKGSSFSPVRNLSLGRSRTEKSKKQEEKEELERLEKTRQKHAFVASEILSSEVWSITETLMENRESLVKFWDFLRQPPTLDPVTAGYFTKINETLLDKKTEDTLEFVKSQEGIVPAMLQHVDCPMVMDLLLKIISMEKAEGGQGIVDWLQSQNLIPMLLEYLGQQHPTFTQTSAGDFLKAIITISANASQNEQSCIGPNSLTRQLVSESSVKPMITNMLKGGNPLTVGVGIIIEVIRKNNSDYDPEVSAAQEMSPSTSDPIYLGNLLRSFAVHVPQFMDLILSSKHTISAGDATISIKRKELPVAFGNSIEPLGFDRFKTCELMAELLHCSNMGLLNERGSEAYVRQRDIERERLRAEGKFNRTQEPPSATTEFSEDGIDESPEFIARPLDLKKLDTTNTTDEDGFEDVGKSGDLLDEMRDDFDPESDIAGSASPLKPSKSRLSLDDEFFDEPLHSPQRSSGLDPQKTPPLETAQSILTSGVVKLDLTQDEKDETSEKSPKISIADDLFAEIDAQLSPIKEAHHVPDPKNKESLTVNNGSPIVQSPGNMSPHSEDTPAPLFSPQHDHSQHEEQRSDGQLTPTQSQDRSNPAWSNEPIDEWAPHIENDVDGQPIVGDFLKMQFVEHQVVPTILDFFFRFPWNNFLHNVVYDVVQQVFNGTMERGYNRALAIDLFTTGRITERVIEGQLRSDEAQARNNLRLGYMGHLTLIAEEVVKFSERHPIEILSEPVLDKVTQRLWMDYVENTLSETRERDNAILGGVRPDVAGGARQAVLDSVSNSTFNNTGSAALANAGLNGAAPGLDSMDLTNQTGGNFLASGSLLSGFGSSSDEEDEEMEEIIDGGEAGTDQQSTTYTPSGFQTLSLFKNSQNDNHSGDNDSNSDDNGNSILTPDSSSSGTSDAEHNGQNTTEPNSFLPPPLKISPSRARRQLAVRLALKEKERQVEKEKAEAESEAEVDNAEDDASRSKQASGGGGIFSPTEGRISTPDTPAFTAGSKIHERGLHSNKRRAAAAANATDDPSASNSTGAGGGSNDSTTQPSDDMTSPMRSDDGSSSDEDVHDRDDPWASLDAAAAKAVAESKSQPESASTLDRTPTSQNQAQGQDEASWFGSSFSSQKQAGQASDPLASVSSTAGAAVEAAATGASGLWARLTGAETNTATTASNEGDNNDVDDDQNVESAASSQHNQDNKDSHDHFASNASTSAGTDRDISAAETEAKSESEEVVIGLAPTAGSTTSLPGKTTTNTITTAKAKPKPKLKTGLVPTTTTSPPQSASSPRASPGTKKSRPGSGSAPAPAASSPSTSSPPSGSRSGSASASSPIAPDAASSGAGSRPKSPKESNNRSTMSRLFQSWQGGSSSSSSAGASSSSSSNSGSGSGSSTVAASAASGGGQDGDGDEDEDGVQEKKM